MKWLAVALGLFLLAPVHAQSPSLDDVRELLSEGQLEQALQAVDTYLQQAEDDRQGRFVKGVVLSELGRTDEAIAVFEQLVQDYPDLPEPHNNLAVLYASRGDLDNARDSLLQAITIHPSYGIAHENLGDIYARMAEVAYQRAVELDKANDAARRKLAQLSDVTSLAGAGDVAKPPPVPTPAAAAAMAVAPAPVPASTPASGRAGTSPAGAPVRELRDTVLAWAGYWSNQDVGAYLASYAADFKPARGLSRSDWESQRRQRLKKPASIQVRISDFAVTRASGSSATVRFAQSYRSSTYSDRVRKQMELRRSGGSWKILSERSLGKI